MLSCRPKPIVLNVKTAPNKLVVYSQIIPGNKMLVFLSRTFSPLENSTANNEQLSLVSGATVRILFDNKTFDFKEYSPGVYKSNFDGYQVDQDYDLLVISGVDTIKSRTKMLPQLDFNTIKPNIEKSLIDTTVYINFSFDDIPNVSNWYLLNFYKKQSTPIVEGGNNHLPIGSNFLGKDSNYLLKTIIVSDKEFSDSYSKKLKLSDVKYNDSIVVTLSNINETYFRYLSYKVGSGGIINQLNIEPLNYPTNILNGYGFFNAHSPSTHFFDLNKF